MEHKLAPWTVVPPLEEEMSPWPPKASWSSHMDASKIQLSPGKLPQGLGPKLALYSTYLLQMSQHCYFSRNSWIFKVFFKKVSTSCCSSEFAVKNLLSSCMGYGFTIPGWGTKEPTPRQLSTCSEQEKAPCILSKTQVLQQLFINIKK